MSWIRVLLIGLGLLQYAAVYSASYKGRPFVLIDSNGNRTPDGGIIRGFSSSQLIGDQVAYTVQDSNFNIFAMMSGRGMTTSGFAPQSLVAGKQTQWPDSNQNFDSFGYNFACGGQDNGFAFTAVSEDQSIGLFQVKDNLLTTLLTNEEVIPSSGGLNWTRIGEPNYVNGRIAWLGFHRFADDTDFRGVYIYENETVIKIADSNTNLPRGVGMFEGSSSQVGFDGETVAFWGGPLSDHQGMFAAEDAESLRALAVKGDTIPGTQLIIESFMSPPVVDNGTIYFVAFSEGFKSHLLKSENGTLSTVIVNGTAAPDGVVFDQIGSAGMFATDGKVYFSSLGSPTHSGIYALEDGQITTVLNNTQPFFQGQKPVSLILRDAVGEKLLVQNVSRGGLTITLHATLDAPAVPVIVEQPKGILTDLGQEVTLEIKVTGPEGVSYQWTKNGRNIEGETGTTLNLPDVQIEDSANYRVLIEFEGTRIFSENAYVELNLPPILSLDLEDKSYESGEALNLRVQAVGLAPFTYEWFKDGELQTNFTGPAIFISPAQESDSGAYQVKITNSLGEILSHPAQIEVLPPPPNPAYKGRRFARLAGGDSTIEGAQGPFRASTWSDGRPAGDSLIFRYYNSGGFTLGLGKLDPDGSASVFLSLADLNQKFGANYNWIENIAADPITGNIAVMLNNTSGQLNGRLLQWTDGNLTELVKASDPIPGNESASVGSFSNAFYQNGSIVFLSIHNQLYHILQYTNGELKTLVSPEDSLPGKEESFVGNILAFDGNRVLFRVGGGLFQVDQEGSITSIAKEGDPLGDSSMTFFGAAAYTQYGIAVMVQDESFNYHFALQSETGFDVLLSPGDTIGDNSVVVFLSGSSIAVSGEDLLFEAGIGPARGLVSYSSENGFKPVLATRKMDGETFNNLRLLGAYGDSVYVTTESSNGNSYIYANTGESVGNGRGSVDDPPKLEFSLEADGSIQFTVPEGFQLRHRPTLRHNDWNIIEGQDSVIVETLEASGFFQLFMP